MACTERMGDSPEEGTSIRRSALLAGEGEKPGWQRSFQRFEEICYRFLRKAVLLEKIIALGGEMTVAKSHPKNPL